MTQHATARRKIVGVVAAVLALAGLVSGCSSRPGAAAVVDGRAIPASDIVTVVDELKPAVPTISSALVLNTLIQEPTLVQLASDKGMGVSPDDATWGHAADADRLLNLLRQAAFAAGAGEEPAA